MASGSGWNLCVLLVGVVVRRYIDFLILLIYPSCICSFLQQHPYFLFIFLMFFVLYIYIYILYRRAR